MTSVYFQRADDIAAIILQRCVDLDGSYVTKLRVFSTNGSGLSMSTGERFDTYASWKEFDHRHGFQLCDRDTFVEKLQNYEKKYAGRRGITKILDEIWRDLDTRGPVNVLACHSLPSH